MEQNPNDWSEALDTTVREVLMSLGSRRSEVVAIGVSGQQHGLVVLDAADAVIRPAKLWCDTTTVTQCATLTERMGGPDAVLRELGNAFLPGYTAPKILWLKENEPEHFQRMRSILLPHDYLNFYLTGEKTMEYGDASGTGLMDVRQREWHSEALAAIDPHVAACLPALRSSWEPAGSLRPKLVEAWGLSGSVVVSSGGGDNMMGAIGTGNVQPGVVTVSLGTSGTLYAFSKTPIIDPAGEVAAFCDSTDFWLPLVCTMNVTLVTELARTLFAWDHARFSEAAAAIPAGAEGLLLLPYLTGERTPNLPSGTGVLSGLTTSNCTPAHFARAAMEGVTLGLGYGLSRFQELGLVPSEIRLTGGGSNSPLWRQLCADLFGVPTVCLLSGEGAALGAAIQALAANERSAGRAHCLGSLTDRLVKVDESSRCIPKQEATEVYAALASKAQATRRALTQAGLLG